MLKFRQKLSSSDRKPTYDTNKSRVYSYSDVSKKNSNLNNSQGKNKKTRKKDIFGRWLLVLVVAAIAGWTMYASTDAIVRFSDDEITIKSESEYAESVDFFLKSSILNRTKLTFDYLDFELKMKEKYPEISSVDTSFAIIGNKPVVRLQFYQPVLTLESLGKKWLVDGRGVALSELASSDANTPVLTDEIGLPTEKGEYVLSSDDVKFILYLHKIAKEKGIAIDKYTTPLVSRQLNVRVVGEGYYTKFNLSEDVKLQVGTWITARQQFLALNQTPGEYVDIRASEKVFWK